MTKAIGPLLACLSAIVLAPAASATTSCTLKRYASIDLEVRQDGVLLPVKIHDTTARMALNIQSSMTVMWKPAATEFQVVLHSFPPRSAVVKFGSTRINEYGVVDSFALGDLKFVKAEFLLVPVEENNRIPSYTDKVIGALGMDFFSKVDFELDFKNHKLNLYSQDHCPGAGAYWANSYASSPLRRGTYGNAYLPFELDGKKIEATLSTGTQTTTLTTDVTRKLYGFDETSSDIETTKDAQGSIVAQYRAMAITAPGLKATNTLIRLESHAKAECGLDVHAGPDRAAQHTNCGGDEAPLHIGLNVLSHLHLYFATKENVLYYTEADSFRPDATTH
jgi:hypothetical protein